MWYKYIIKYEHLIEDKVDFTLNKYMNSSIQNNSDESRLYKLLYFYYSTIYKGYTEVGYKRIKR